MLRRGRGGLDEVYVWRYARHNHWAMSIKSCVQAPPFVVTFCLTVLFTQSRLSLHLYLLGMRMRSDIKTLQQESYTRFRGQQSRR